MKQIELVMLVEPHYNHVGLITHVFENVRIFPQFSFHRLKSATSLIRLSHSPSLECNTH